MRTNQNPPIALTEKLDLRKTMVKTWLVEETMHSKTITVILLKGKKPSRLFIEGNHVEKFQKQVNRDIVIHFEWGRILWVITPTTTYLWKAEMLTNDKEQKEKAKYSTHWCGKPGSCSHWTHLFDEDMPLRAVELCLQEVAKNFAKCSISDIAADIVIWGGKREWKSWAKGPVASFYINAPHDTGEEFRYCYINCIQGLPTRHPHWLDSFVMTSTNKGRPVFGLPRPGSSQMTLREFLATQEIA